MAKRIFILSDVSDKTSEDIIKLLNDHYINYYITPFGDWTQSLGAIWVKDHSQTQFALEVLNKYFDEQNINVTENKKLLDNANRSIYSLRIFSNPALYIFYIPTFIIVLLMLFLLT